MERRSLFALNANELTVLPTDKGNVTVVLSTANYNQKIAILLEDQAYRKLEDTLLSLRSKRPFFSS
jgi:hypothetical protein